MEESKKLLGRFVSFKYTDVEQPVEGILLDTNEEYTFLLHCPGEYVIDGYAILNNEGIEGYRYEEEEQFKEQVLNLKGAQDMVHPELSLHLPDILQAIKDKYQLCAIYRYSDDGAFVVGKPVQTNDHEAYLQVIDERGQYQEEVAEFDIDDIRLVVFDDDYLHTMNMLAKDPPEVIPVQSEKPQVGNLVELKYKDSEELIEGVLLATNDNFSLLLQNTFDYETDGYIICNHQKIEYYRSTPEQDFKALVLKLKGVHEQSHPNIKMESVKQMLQDIKQGYGMCQLALYSEEDACYVGYYQSVKGKDVVLKDVDIWGVPDDEEGYYPLNDIRTIEFGTDYLKSLQLVADNEPL